MTDCLLEIARELGVEIKGYCQCRFCHADKLHYQRPRLDIAHEVLGKLPKTHAVWCYGGDDCVAEISLPNNNKVHTMVGKGTFESAVVALAERFLRERRAAPGGPGTEIAP